MTEEVRRPLPRPVTIPSLAGGWVDIEPAWPSLVDWWRERGYQPEADLKRPLRDDDLLCTVTIHVPDGSSAALVAWSAETQRQFVHFLAGIERMTHTFPQRAAFDDGSGRFEIDALAYLAPGARRKVHVRLSIRLTSAVTNLAAAAELTIQQSALRTIAGSCCDLFPAVGVADWFAAWS